MRFVMLAVSALGLEAVLFTAALPRFDRELLLEQSAETSANVSIGDLNGDKVPDLVLAKGRHWPLIDRVLMLSEVRRVVPREPTEADITARVEAIRQRFPSPAALQQALAAGGISEPVIRIYAEDDLSLAAYLDERFSAAAQPTDQEVLQAGEANRRKLADERRRTLISAWVAELRRRADISLLQ